MTWHVYFPSSSIVNSLKVKQLDLAVGLIFKDIASFFLYHSYLYLTPGIGFSTLTVKHRRLLPTSAVISEGSNFIENPMKMIIY